MEMLSSINMVFYLDFYYRYGLFIIRALENEKQRKTNKTKKYFI